MPHNNFETGPFEDRHCGGEKSGNRTAAPPAVASATPFVTAMPTSHAAAHGSVDNAITEALTRFPAGPKPIATRYAPTGTTSKFEP